MTSAFGHKISLADRLPAQLANAAGSLRRGPQEVGRRSEHSSIALRLKLDIIHFNFPQLRLTLLTLCLHA